MLVLFTDTDTDMTPRMAEEYGYRLISMPYSIEDKNIYPYVDFDEFNAHEFYDVLRSGVVPKTSALNVDEYKEYFEPVFANGDDILYLHFSKNMSGTFNAMEIAARELLEKYPERKFDAIDTNGISIGSLILLEQAGEMYKRGAGVEEIRRFIEEENRRYAIYFFADDLSFFKRSGRVSGLAGAMGTLLSIRPIMHINDEGKLVSIGKEKGRKKALERLISTVIELGDEVEKHRIIITHSDAPEIVEEAERMLKAHFGENLDIELIDVNPTVGCHCGPSTVGICFRAKHR
ncbi:MAG: DegV family protein [Clostridia bacterium]|nr:DegV family protein [Clostridia bacterium]